MAAPRLLTLCFPTYGRQNELHLNSRGDAVVLAPDEFHTLLLKLGWLIDVVSLAPPTDKPLFCSGLPLKSIADVAFSEYDVYWHMFRDPTQPEVLEMLDHWDFDYRGKPVINHVDNLQHHQKHRYARVLWNHGIGPEIVALLSGDRTGWTIENSSSVSPDRQWIESYAYNNNRGDYPTRRPEQIVTRYVDNCNNGLRSVVRFGYAFGGGLTGFLYRASNLAFKTGAAREIEEYVLPERFRQPLCAAMEEIRCDICHIDAIPQEDRRYIVDINPYPTAQGRTLSVITQALVDRLHARFCLQ